MVSSVPSAWSVLVFFTPCYSIIPIECWFMCWTFDACFWCERQKALNTAASAFTHADKDVRTLSSSEKVSTFMESSHVIVVVSFSLISVPVNSFYQRHVLEEAAENASFAMYGYPLCALKVSRHEPY